MARSAKSTNEFNIFIVGQNGRLTYEAVLFAASLRHFDPDFSGRLFVAEPQAGPNWPADPRMTDAEAISLLTGELGAEILPFSNVHFGQTYAQGNKIEALLAMPRDEPFIFLDTDTLITVMERSHTSLGVWFWAAYLVASQTPHLISTGLPPRCGSAQPGPNHSSTGSDIPIFGARSTTASILILPARWTCANPMAIRQGPGPELAAQSLDPWRRFNAGWFFYRCPHEFGARFLDYALAMTGTCRAIALVIHSLGGERQTIPPGLLDGETSCHYRTMPLLFARESEQVITALNTVSAPNKIKKVLKQYEPMKRFIYQNRGQKVRDMFDQNNLPLREKTLRNQIKKAGLWMR